MGTSQIPLKSICLTITYTQEIYFMLDNELHSTEPFSPRHLSQFLVEEFYFPLRNFHHLNVLKWGFYGQEFNKALV